jgi:hypothetical protein
MSGIIRILRIQENHHHEDPKGTRGAHGTCHHKEGRWGIRFGHKNWTSIVIQDVEK